MALQVKRVDVWAGEIDDRKGGLAKVLDPLAKAGASLECVIARRMPDKKGKGIVFLAPVKGKKVQAAAKAAGLKLARNIPTVRVESPDRKGMGAKMMRAVADAGVNMRGISTMSRGRKFVTYIGLDTPAAASKAARALRALKV